MKSLLCYTICLCLSIMLDLPVMADLPTQQIVFVIDTSGSMKISDPLSLRGVASCLVLDSALLLSKNVESGIIFFSDVVDADKRMSPASEVKARLQSNLPPASGATNLGGALESALSLIKASPGDNKRIVLITDGEPVDVSNKKDTEQIKRIKDIIVPEIRKSGIKLLSLGLSKSINEAFLKEISDKTVICVTHTHLLESAKQLLGAQDNIFIIDNKHILSDQSEYQFEMPEGIDMGRVTLLFDNAELFKTSQVEVSVSGPGISENEAWYTIMKNTTQTVVVWTAFYSSPPAGKYKVVIKTNKPGMANNNGGLLAFVEVRTDLNLEVLLSPSQDNYSIGEKISVKVIASRASGSIDLDQSKIDVSGKVITQDGNSVPIKFSVTNGEFTVPEPKGKQIVHIEARTSQLFPPTINEAKHYQATPVEPAEFRVSSQKIQFVNPLSPQYTTTAGDLILYADSPNNKFRKIEASAYLMIPELHELATLKIQNDGGGELKLDGKKRVSIPKEGLKMQLSFSYGDGCSIEKPFNLKPGKYGGFLKFSSTQAETDCEIPFELFVQVPQLKLNDHFKNYALWWDTEHSKKINLGNLESDTNMLTEFRISVPFEDLLVTDPVRAKGRPIGTWCILNDTLTKTPGTKPGEFYYEPIEPFTDTFPLLAEISPNLGNGGDKLIAGLQTFTFEVQSKFTQKPTKYKKALLTLPRPWNPPHLLGQLIGPISFHMKHILTWLFVGIPGLLLLFVIPSKRIARLFKYRGWKTGKEKVFKAGFIQIEEELETYEDGESRGLTLPKIIKSSPEGRIAQISYLSDNGTFSLQGIHGNIFIDNKLLKSQPEDLRVYRVLGIADPDDEDKLLWEMECIDINTKDNSITFLILENPIQDSVWRILKNWGKWCIFCFILKIILNSALMANWAYKIPLDSMYVYVAQLF